MIVTENRAGELRYLLPDGLGSVRQALDEDGRPVFYYEFDPYGNPVNNTGGGDPYGYTGEWWDSATELLHLRARWYDPAVGRFLSRDPLLGDILQAQTQNPYVYGVNNPLNYLDPSGQTVRSALDLVRQYRDDIKFVAGRHALEPILLAGVVFAENRNDYNLIKYHDWTAELAAKLTGCYFGGPEIKNFLGSIFRKNVSIGITEVTVAVAAMVDDPDLVPDDYGRISSKERAALHTKIAEELPPEKRSSILDSLADPQTSLEYAAKFLRFLSEYRDYGDNFALWLSDYNRGLTSEGDPNDYGKRFNTYRKNIQYVLNWQVTPPYWVPKPGMDMDQFYYGELP